jgi:hypothetical protein
MGAAEEHKYITFSILSITLHITNTCLAPKGSNYNKKTAGTFKGKLFKDSLQGFLKNDTQGHYQWCVSHLALPGKKRNSLSAVTYSFC